jgi:hypothetical protein
MGNQDNEGVLVPVSGSVLGSGSGSTSMAHSSLLEEGIYSDCFVWYMVHKSLLRRHIVVVQYNE